MNILLKFPVGVSYTNNPKKHLKNIANAGYGYLAFDSKGKLVVFFEAKIYGQKIRLTPAKYYLQQSLLHSTLIRPIRAPVPNNLWLKHSIFDAVNNPPIESVDPVVIKEYLAKAQKDIAMWLNCDLNDKQRANAERQRDRLINRNAAIDLMDPVLNIISMTTIK